MYRILYNDQIIFDPYGDGEVVTDAKMSTEVNAASYLDFTMSPLHPLYNTIKERDGIVRLYYDAEELFEGVIETIETDFNGYKSISCVSALDYLNDTLVRPYSTVGGEEPLTAPDEINRYFEWLIDQHNSHVLDAYKQFQIGVNQGANLSSSNQIYVKQDSSSTTANEITNNLIDAFGGYLMLRYVDGNLVLDLYADVHDMNAQIIDFGVNLLDFNKTVDTADQYTALRPVGGTPEKKEGSGEDPRPTTIESLPDGPTMYNTDVTKQGDVIYSVSGVARYGYKETEWKTDDTTDPAKLLELAVPQLVKQSSPLLNIDIKAVDLALYMDGYEHLRVGQAVRIRSNPHGVDEYMMVSSIDLDLQDPGQSDYQLGVSYDTLTGQQSAYLRNLNAGINSSLDSVASLDQITKDHAIQIGHVTEIAEEAKDTANNAQNTANSNKEEIDQIKDQQSEQDKLLEQMQAGVEQAEQEISGINDRLTQMDSDIEQAQSDIDSLRSSTETEFQNVKQSVSKVQSDVESVSKKAEDLASDLDGTKATVEQVTTDLGEVKTTVSNAATKADQALQVSTSASQTATEAKTTATSAYQDAQSALTQSSVASQTANAVKTELETKYSTTDEIAEQYATKSLVEQTSQSITSTVEATYATKATVEALENIANNAVQTWMGSGVPTLSNKPASDWNTAELKSQHSGDIYYDSDTGYSYRFGSSDGKNYSWSLIKDTDISKAVADAAKAQQTAEGVSDEVTQLKTDIPATYATKTEVKQTTDSIKSSVSEVATTANSALSKATTVEQTANGLQTTVTEQAEKLDGAVTTISQVSQKVDSVSSTITQVQGDISDLDDAVSEAQKDADTALSQSSTVQQELTSFKTSVQQTYETKNDALSKQSSLQQSVNNLRTEVSETYLTKTSAQQTYSTKSYVDQTARTVSLGVVEEYKNGQHGSALATQSDITAAKDSITSTVSQTYLSKTDATNTYLNKNTAASTYATKTEVKQTSDSLTVTISSAVSKAESAATAASNAQNTANTAKTNAATAQSAADKANTNAQNAQNRVGNLETCIKMTSNGVRVGKISNGNFTGYSALVNSAGSFDILGSNSKNVVSFGPTATRFYDSNGNAKLAMLYNPSSSLYQVGTVSSNSAASIDSGFTVDGQWLKLESINRNIEISAANGRILLKPSGDRDNPENGISFYSGVRFETDGTALRHIYRGSLVANPNGANGLSITHARRHMNGDVCVAINGDWRANRLVVMGCDYDQGLYNVRLYNPGSGSFNSTVRIDWCVFETEEFTPQ